MVTVYKRLHGHKNLQRVTISFHDGERSRVTEQFWMQSQAKILDHNFVTLIAGEYTVPIVVTTPCGMS